MIDGIAREATAWRGIVESGAVRHMIRSYAAMRPEVFFPLYSLKRINRQLMVSRDSELVIEGYPRCANTYSVVAFELAQGRECNLGHHLHVPAQIMRALDYGIPAVALVRAPKDAVSSLLIRHPELNPRYCLSDYIDFYGYIAEVVDRVVIADFRQVTEDIDTMIQAVNDKYATTFRLKGEDASFDERVFQRIGEIHRAAGRAPNQIAIPTDEKKAARERLAAVWQDPRIDALLERAQRIYDSVLSNAQPVQEQHDQ